MLAYFGVAVLGAALGVNVVLTLGGVAAWITPFAAYDYWVIFSAAVASVYILVMTAWVMPARAALGAQFWA